MSIQNLLEILDRAHSGPVCSLKDWDTQVIPTKAAAVIKKYGLAETCTPDNPINTDDALADRFFQAGFELAVEAGMLCVDTERVIKVSQEELQSTIEKAPAELAVGEGLDRLVMRARQPEDKQAPLLISPLGIEVSEELWVPLMQGIAQHREVDILQGGSLKSVFGRPIRSGTPYETLAGRLNAQLNREALWRADRPGMCTTAVITSPTVFGQLGGYGIPGGFRPTDLALVLAPAELKTTYTALHKVAHAINCGGLIMSGACSMVGGYAGPPEGAAISAIAWALLQYAVHQNHCGGGAIMDIRYMGNCGRHAQWAISVQLQALSRNTHLLINSLPNQVAGPCTEMLLYESAVAMMNLAVSGTSLSIGPRSAGGKYTDYLSPLECKFCGQVLKRCAEMKRSEANEIANVLIPKYEDRLRNPPKGKSFTECYDLHTLRPTQEWLDIYLRVKEELIELGMPLENA
jgi:methylamine--corrinoid protein Co-methyltransferase